MCYSPSISSISFGEAKDGKNMVVSLGGSTYDVQIEKIMEPEDDANVAARAAQVPADTIFLLGGNFYVKLSGNDKTTAGTVVKLEGRRLDKTGFKTLKSALAEKSTPVQTVSN